MKVIDPAKLLKRVLIDTGILIRALGDRPQDPEAKACRDFWDAMLQHGRTILIAAPSIAEVVRFGVGAAADNPVPNVPGVEVVAFDQSAAMRLGHDFPINVIKKSSSETGRSLTHLKYDALIAACALRHNAQCLVTLDKGEMNTMCKHIELETREPSRFYSDQRVFIGEGF